MRWVVGDDKGGYGVAVVHAHGSVEERRWGCRLQVVKWANNGARANRDIDAYCHLFAAPLPSLSKILSLDNPSSFSDTVISFK